MRLQMKKAAIGMIGAIILFVGSSCGGGGGAATIAEASTTGAADGYVYESIDGDMGMVARTTGRLPGILPLVGASVECEGKTAITTSRGYFMLTGLPAGSRIINATKPGYRPIKIPVIIRRNDTVHAVEENSTDGALEPESSGQVAVSSTPQGAAISIDGRETAFITPNTLNNIVVGQHVISVALSGYNVPDAVTVTVSGDAAANADFTLTAEQAAEENISQPDTDTNTTPDDSAPASDPVAAGTYVIVDTAQEGCYSETSNMACADDGAAFYGQDAQYDGAQPSYTDNGDGTVTDNVTGLMWQKDPGSKMTMSQAQSVENSFNLAGYTDWRLPTIKELYSLIMFYGTDPSSSMYSSDTSGLTPFIDMDYFDFEYGDTTSGERIIDSQFLSSNIYVGDGFDAVTVFGVNFADGRIKGYGTSIFGREKTFFVMFVRGGSGYGENDFVDNGNGTVADYATGLTWTQDDSGEGMVWEEALSYCEDMNFAGASDWRLPNAKELQSILDYSRAPSLTNSAAIDPLFNVSEITNEGGVKDYPYFWTSTTHANQISGGSGVYVAFGRGLGYMNYRWVDVHGAGAQRSDPKSGDPSVYPTGHGPQGDAIRIYNYARCVRGGATKNGTSGRRF